MKINLEKLYTTQKELDNHILEKKGLTSSDVFYDKLLALLVELGEHANEWRGFKYWSENQNANREKMLEEYVDCLHFILSAGIEFDITPKEVDIEISDKPINKQIIEVFSTITDIYDLYERDPRNEQIHHEYYALLDKFTSLSHSLGLTLDEIINAYFDKNEVNHERQENNY